MRIQPSRTYNPGNTWPEGETMRLRLRRRNEGPPLARPGLFTRVPLTPEVADWLVARDGDRVVSESAEAAARPSPPPPPAISANGFRAQATPTDARAERLVRGLRMELEDIKQTIAAHDDDRDGLVAVDLDAVRADPRAAAALPPATLARALAAAAGRIAALEREIVSHERENTALRDQLARLQDEHSYTRGRTETLHEVIAALHGNLEDLRSERLRRNGLAPGALPPAIAPPDRDAEPSFRLRDQRESCQ